MQVLHPGKPWLIILREVVGHEGPMGTVCGRKGVGNVLSQPNVHPSALEVQAQTFDCEDSQGKAVEVVSEDI